MSVFAEILHVVRMCVVVYCISSYGEIQLKHPVGFSDVFVSANVSLSTVTLTFSESLYGLILYYLSSLGTNYIAMGWTS